METKESSSQKLGVCMLLSLRYVPDMLVYPSINVLSYIRHFGHQVTWVISSERGHELQQFYFNGVKVYAIPYRHYFPGDFILAKIFNQILHSLQKVRFDCKVFSEGRYDHIFVRNDVFDGLAALYIKWKHRVPFIFEISNPLEMEWEVYKIASKKPIFLYYLIAKFNELLTLHLLHRADLVLPISKWLNKDFVNRKGIAESKLIPLPEAVDVVTFLNGDGEDVVEMYHMSNSKVVIYEGTLDKTRNLSILLQAFSMVKGKKRDVKLLIVGDGTDQECLQKLADELGIKDDVIFTGRVPQSEVPNFIATADIGVCPVPPLSFFKMSSPIKMLEYMGGAKPVVANEEIPEQKEVLKESGGGVLVPYTPEAFADAIIKLLDNPWKAAEMGQRGRKWVVKNRSYEVLARQVEERYLELLGNSA